MNEVNRKYILEAALFSSPEPLTLERLQQLFKEQDRPSPAEIKNLLSELSEDYEKRGVELCEVASGYRFQVKSNFAPWLQRLWEKKPPRYSRALLETLALVAYRQPISRGEIEEIRGVTVSSDIMKKLLDREWIKVEGYRDVPGKPALYVTTKAFLDYFNLKKITDLPPLEEVVDLEEKGAQLAEQLALSVILSPKEEEDKEENNEDLRLSQEGVG
ncbi:SMC-Scp complex subunit ScpB [Candidatus Coxiella mudrowiae]|uniref:Segregation and condensation protein B n=1 Tax=Candidatus Coxiella mudrowiae TaxID=2054173 RepID=A0ABM5UUV0_9COXI|nr:SMC-Scp complex subunit ScpB [Candidatus Coxiella mudrowiae]AKQ33707.1 Segregation and condensation protein B [Candidatus Coxiella mudrowiae]